MPDDFYETLGGRVRERRKALHLTLEQLAERVGKSDASYLARIENARRRVSLEKLRAIAVALEVELGTLLAADTSASATDHRLLAAARRLDTRDQALLAALVEQWVLFVGSARSTRPKTPTRSRR